MELFYLMSGVILYASLLVPTTSFAYKCNFLESDLPCLASVSLSHSLGWGTVQYDSSIAAASFKKSLLPICSFSYASSQW